MHVFKIAIAQKLNGNIDFLLFYIIINKMKQQITENEENLFFGKNRPGVISDLNYGGNGQERGF